MKFEPVRLYAIATAVVAIVVHYVPSVPGALVLALAAAIFGVGEGVVRAAVTPVAKLRRRPEQAR